MIPALLGDEVDLLWSCATVAASQGNAMRMLAVAQEPRHPLFPDAPTFRKLGIDMVGGACRGIAVTQSTPENIRRELSDIIGPTPADPDFTRQMEEAGFAFLNVFCDQMDAFMAEKRQFHDEIARQLGTRK